MPNIKNDFINTSEVVKLLPFSRSTLNKLVKQGKFPQPYKPTEKLNLWNKADVNKWINDNFGGVQHG